MLDESECHMALVIAVAVLCWEKAKFYEREEDSLKTTDDSFRLM